MVKILSGPYTTVLEAMGKKDVVADSRAIIDQGDLGNEAREVTEEVARQYIATGIDIATTNTFGLRHILRGDGGPEKLRDFTTALRIQLEIVQKVIDTVRWSRLRPKRTFVPFGPYAHNCYDPKSAPKNDLDAMLFHSNQVEPFFNLTDGDPFISPMFETITTTREALGIAHLLKSHQDVPGYISFAVDKAGDLLSGENIGETIAEIEEWAPWAVKGFGVNCFPFDGGVKALEKAGAMVGRIKLFNPNASGDIDERAERLWQITQKYPTIEIVGGCCGNDSEDIRRIVERFRGEANQVPQFHR